MTDIDRILNESETQIFEAPADEPTPAALLEALFDAPERYENDSKWAGIHSELIRRMRSEASGLQMGTVQLTMIERIATYYTYMREREESNERQRPADMKLANDLWQTLAVEFNKTLAASRDESRQGMLIEIQKIVLAAIDTLAEPAERKRMGLLLKEGFASINL